jgi:hypothetical protein
MYISSKMFTLGTKTEELKSFEVDPNIVIKKAHETCRDEKEEITSPTDLSISCQILSSSSSNPEDYVNCLETIKEKLNYKDSDSASVAISKLYTLHPDEQKFMAYILTMYGEARGMRPPEHHMAGVMKTIDNRHSYARKKYPDATELDVVLQDLQFSMYNKKDPNWRQAMKASPQLMMAALTTYAKKNIMSIEINPKGEEIQKIYHYATTDLCNSSSPPRWINSKKHVKLVIDGKDLPLNKGHMFYQSIPWTFNPNNRYKSFAKQEGIIP